MEPRKGALPKKVLRFANVIDRAVDSLAWIVGEVADSSNLAPIRSSSILESC
jgi:hypothetical protein